MVQWSPFEKFTAVSRCGICLLQSIVWNFNFSTIYRWNKWLLKHSKCVLLAGNSFYQPGFLAITLWFVHSICPFSFLGHQLLLHQSKLQMSWTTGKSNVLCVFLGFGLDFGDKMLNLFAFAFWICIGLHAFGRKPREMWGFYSLVFRYRTRGLCFWPHAKHFCLLQCLPRFIWKCPFPHKTF